MKQLYTLIETAKHLADFKEAIKTVDSVAYDIETTGLDWFTDKMRLAQFDAGGNTYIINMETNPTKAKENLDYVINLLHAQNKTIISHNAKFEIKFTLENTGILLTNVFCTQVAEMVLTAGKYPRQRYFALAELTETYCDKHLDKEIRKKFLESEVITEEMLIYAAEDVKYLDEIKFLQQGEAKNQSMDKVIRLEMRLLPIVAKMEYDGVGFNWHKWSEMAKKNEALAEELEPQIVDAILEQSWDGVKEFISDGMDAYEVYGLPIPAAMHSKSGKTDRAFLMELTNPTFIRKQIKDKFNIRSPKQMKTALILSGVPVENTQADTLVPYRDNPVVQKISEYREVSKKATTYGMNWAEHIHPKTQRIHPQFNSVGTVTGRWSSDNPNLQNVPAEKDYRSCFIAAEGYKLVTADYSQAELRFVGAVSGEQNIIDAYKAGEDIHAKTASIIYDKPIEEVTKEERSRGKTLNFSILYGSTKYGISKKNPDIDMDEAEFLLKKFFAGYPRLAEFIKQAGKRIWDKRISRTPLGRIRFFDSETLFSSDRLKFEMERVKREGFNIIIQGGSADALKIAMIDAFYNNPFGDENFRFVLQVHDEVTAEVKEEILQDGIEYLIKCMEDAEQIFLGDIPAKADYVVGDCWMKD